MHAVLLLRHKYLADQSYLFFEQCRTVSEMIITISTTFFKLQIGVVNGSEEYKLGVLMNADMKSKKFQTFTILHLAHNMITLFA